MNSSNEWTTYDFVKNALIGAALGGVASMFVPLLGPLKGALLGAFSLVALGVYRNLSGKSSAVTNDDDSRHRTLDVAAELAKFDELRKGGVITEEEFQVQKKRLLR
jgi:hypothetical protein